MDGAIQQAYEKYIPEAKAKMPKSTSQFAAFLPKETHQLKWIWLTQTFPTLLKTNDAAVITIGKTSGELATAISKTTSIWQLPRKRWLAMFPLHSIRRAKSDRDSECMWCSGDAELINLPDAVLIMAAGSRRRKFCCRHSCRQESPPVVCRWHGL